MNDIEKIIDDLKENDAVIIRGYRNSNELVHQIQSAIDVGKPAIFEPTIKSLRIFFNTAGFIATLTKLLGDLNNYEIIVPPNIYGTKHVMVIGPKAVLDAAKNDT